MRRKIIISNQTEEQSDRLLYWIVDKASIYNNVKIKLEDDEE